MKHLYKVKKYTTLKASVIPIQVQEEVTFQTETDLLLIESDIDLKSIEEFIDGEWIGLDVLKERKQNNH